MKKGPATASRNVGQSILGTRITLGMIAGLALLLAVSGCTTSTQTLSSAKEEAEQEQQDVALDVATDPAGTDAEDPPEAEAEPEETAKIIRKPATVTQKGTYIRALVNGDPITNYDVQRRAKFRQLRRLSAGQDASLEELVEQKLKLQEAAKRGTIATDSEVEEAFGRFAENNRSTTSKVASDLNRLGVGADHFREFIRGQISWNRTIGAKLRAETTQKSASAAIFELRRSGGAKPEVTEYQLQQIIFVIPEAKRSTLMKARKNEALNFKQNFAGCEHSFDFAKTLTDVAVKNLGRMMEPELPQLWKDDIVATPVGQATNPRETEKGVEVIAVCKSRVTSDDRAAQISSQAAAFENLEEAGSQESDAYLAEVRKSATIVYR